MPSPVPGLSEMRRASHRTVPRGLASGYRAPGDCCSKSALAGKIPAYSALELGRPSHLHRQRSQDRGQASGRLPTKSKSGACDYVLFLRAIYLATGKRCWLVFARYSQSSINNCSRFCCNCSRSKAVKRGSDNSALHTYGTAHGCDCTRGNLSNSNRDAGAGQLPAAVHAHRVAAQHIVGCGARRRAWT